MKVKDNGETVFVTLNADSGKSKQELPPLGEWQPWNGGECPVPGNSVVKVMFPDGEFRIQPARVFSWSNDGGYGDIISYCITECPPEPKRVSVPEPNEVDKRTYSRSPRENGYLLILRYGNEAERDDAYEALKGGDDE